MSIDLTTFPVRSRSGSSKEEAGQCWVVAKRGGKEIWKFLVISPDTSSGSGGTGLGIRYADYKKKRVLRQGHVPILYEDGSDITPGDNGGNFSGVQIYTRDEEIVLVSQSEIGRHHYVSEWRFHPDGTILPRLGFASAENGCVCNTRQHHVYWRLDFAIETSLNNAVEEFNDPVLIGNGHWHQRSFELRMFRDRSRRRKWRIANPHTGSNYEIIPGADDGVADSFGAGDLWILRHHGNNEIEDGVYVVAGTADQRKAHLVNFVAAAVDDNRAAVIWYGAHFTNQNHLQTQHMVGPTLKCAKW